MNSKNKSRGKSIVTVVAALLAGLAVLSLGVSLFGSLGGGGGGMPGKDSYIKDELCTVHSGEWAITQLPTATVEGTLSKKCVDCRSVYETQVISPLYNPTDVFTVAEDVITLSSEKTSATATVNAPKAGFYYVEVKASVSSDAYFKMTSSAFSHYSRHRILYGTWTSREYSPYGFTVYLANGENTVTLQSDEGVALESLTGFRFTRVSENIVTSAKLYTPVQVNGDSQTALHTLTVAEDGFYTLGGLLRFGVDDNLYLKMTVTFSREGYADKTIKVNISDIQGALEDDGHLYDGSTNSTFYTALSAVDLDAGDYTVTVKLSSAAFGRFINYQGIVLTSLATE